MSIIPDLILEAMIAQASSPDEHNLLTAMMVVVTGYPANMLAILFVTSPAPG